MPYSKFESDSQVKKVEYSIIEIEFVSNQLRRNKICLKMHIRP